ncbi:MAG: low temperature requirement protein A [Planctomycetota bacterium]
MSHPAAILKYHDEHRHATWLELFFDLVFVAAIGVITHHLAHVHDGHIPTKDFILYPVEFVPLWWIWATHTLYANRFDTDSKGHRLASLLIMFLIVTMSGFLGASLSSGAIAFIGFYVAVRFVLALMFLSSRKNLHGARDDATSMALLIGFGIAVSGLSLLLSGTVQQIVFLGGIAAEMVGAVILGTRKTNVPVHREHLVERIGLLSIILLGESVISMVAGLRGIEWTASNLTAAITGFIMIVSIWWIYFDSFNTLEHAKRITHGYALLYSHVLFCLGLGALASLIGHVVLDDVGASDYRLLAIGGLTLFYFGKQIAYWHAFPPFRPNLVINSVVCIGITVGSSFLPSPVHALIGMTAGLLFYVFSNFRWTLTKDVSAYLASHEATSADTQ